MPSQESDQKLRMAQTQKVFMTARLFAISMACIFITITASANTQKDNRKCPDAAMVSDALKAELLQNGEYTKHLEWLSIMNFCALNNKTASETIRVQNIEKAMLQKIVPASCEKTYEPLFLSMLSKQMTFFRIGYNSSEISHLNALESDKEDFCAQTLYTIEEDANN